MDQKTVPATSIRLLAPLLCAIWAGWICHISGMRGFFAMDQSIIFDGAWRILHGQVPFRDFFLPHGPLAMWIQAAAFWGFGVSYKVYVLTATAMNMGGAIMAYGTFRFLVPDKIWPALASGLITGSWLYAPMGTTYIEQTAFFFIWGAVFFVVGGIRSSSVNWGWGGLAGFSLAAAILAKTNAGMLAVPPLFLMAAIPAGRPIWQVVRGGLGMALGLGSGMILFTFWLYQQSDPGAFYHYAIEIAGREGRRRVLENKDFYYIVCSLFNGKGNDLIRILTVAGYLIMGFVVTLTFGPWKKIKEALRLQLLGLTGLAWSIYQQIFGITSNNNGINEQPLIGLIWVCVALLIFDVSALCRLPEHRKLFARFTKRATLALGGFSLAFIFYFYSRGIRGMGNFDFILGAVLACGACFCIAYPHELDFWRIRALTCGTALALVVVFIIGSWGSYFRQAQDFFNFQTQFVPHTDIAILRDLAWAEGVNDDARRMHPTWPEFVETWRILHDAPGRFYLKGNYTILYAATGKPSLGLLSWFFKGLTYSTEYDPQLDQRFAGLVDQADVTYFVVEEDCPEGSPSPLRDFPKLDRVLREKYRSERKIGLFHLYRRI
jgi:hypothetical protein